MLPHDQADLERAGDAPALRSSPRRIWAIALMGGLLAGVGSWLAGEWVLQTYRPALLPPIKPMPTLDDAQAILSARITSGTLALGLMGGCIGLAGGLAGGASRRSIGWAAQAGLLGLGLGAVANAAVVRLILPLLYARIDPQANDLILPLLGHEALWVSAGAAGGLAFGLGAGKRDRWWEPMLGGLIGAALATVGAEVAGALLFPTDRTQLPMFGTTETRAMAQILVALGAAVGSVLGSGLGKPKSELGTP